MKTLFFTAPTIGKFEKDNPEWVSSRHYGRRNIAEQWEQAGQIGGDDVQQVTATVGIEEDGGRIEQVAFYRRSALDALSAAAVRQQLKGLGALAGMAWASATEFGDERGLWLTKGETAKRAQCSVSHVKILAKRNNVPIEHHTVPWTGRGRNYILWQWADKSEGDEGGRPPDFATVLNQSDAQIQKDAAPVFYPADLAAVKLGVQPQIMKTRPRPFGLQKHYKPRCKIDRLKGTKRRRSVPEVSFVGSAVDEIVAHNTVPPDKMTIPQAAEETGYAVQTIINWTEACPHLPGGRGIQTEVRSFIRSTGSKQPRKLVDRADIAAIIRVTHTSVLVTEEDIIANRMQIVGNRPVPLAAAGQTTAVPVPAGKQRKGRGTAPDADPKKDEQIREAWLTGRYARYAELGHAFHLTPEEVEQAIDRDRKRQRKAQETVGK